MSTGRNFCPPAWETAFITLASCQNLQPLALCNATNNLVGYVTVVHDCQTGKVTPIFLDTNFVRVSALPSGYRPCQACTGSGNIQIQAGDPNFTPLFQSIETVCVLLPDATGIPQGPIQAQRITVRDAANTILTQSLADIATGATLTNATVVECPG